MDTARLIQIEQNIIASRVKKMGRHEAYQVAQARALAPVASAEEKRWMVANGLANWGIVRGGIEIFYPDRKAIRALVEAGEAVPFVSLGDGSAAIVDGSSAGMAKVMWRGTSVEVPSATVPEWSSERGSDSWVDEVQRFCQGVVEAR